MPDSIRSRHWFALHSYRALFYYTLLAEKSAACCDVNVGAMEDPDVALGLAHFLEVNSFLPTIILFSYFLSICSSWGQNNTLKKMHINHSFQLMVETLTLIRRKKKQFVSQN